MSRKGAKGSKTTAADAERLRPHWFKPGQSGNPNGRPKKIERAIDKLAEGLDAATAFYIEVMQDKDATRADKFRAAEAILDRVAGRPKQTVETKADEDTRQPQDMTDAELIERLRRGPEGNGKSAGKGIAAPSGGSGRPN